MGPNMKKHGALTDIVQRLLENVEQHVRMCAVEIEHARQTQLMIDVM